MRVMDQKYNAMAPEDYMTHMFDFIPLENIPTKTDYLFINKGPNPEAYKVYDNIVAFSIEYPNCLILKGDNTHHYDMMGKQHKFIKFLTICPYSVDYFNKFYNFDKFQHVFLPFNLKFIPTPQEKTFDVFYVGNIPTPIDEIFPVMKKFKPCVVAFSGGTHPNQTFVNKLNLNSQSKISIVHGLLRWCDTSTPDVFPDHEAFTLVKEYGIVPQFKMRTLEAAACRSLILCKRDPWNHIEYYFEPDVDFLYWDKSDDLEEKINHILNHYDDYIPMIENAYDKLINNFTVECFFDKFLKNL